MDWQTITNLTGWEIALLLWIGATPAAVLGLWWAAEHAPHEHELWPDLKPQAPDIEKLTEPDRPKSPTTRTEDWLDRLSKNLPAHLKPQAD